MDPRTTIAMLDGLKPLWAGLTRRAAPMADVPLRTLLDTLGLGLEQTLAHLATTAPDYETFLDWIAATAGPPSPAALERYRAWHAGEPPPPAEQARQAAVMAAAPVFDAADLDRWARDGVIVLRGAINTDAAAAAAAHLCETVGADTDDPNSWYEQRPNGIMVQQFQHPTLEVARRSPRVHKAFAQLYGHADLIVSVDRLSFNPPERPDHPFRGPHLHWDANLTPPIPFETQGILYLTDTAADQGALQLVPGFHHRLAEGWLDTVTGDPRQVDLSTEAVTVPAGAGDLVIWRQDLPHGASPNRATRPRLAQYVTMYPLSRSDDRAWL